MARAIAVSDKVWASQMWHQMVLPDLREEL